MAHLILFDNENRDNFLPLAFTRPVCELRVGILTIREKWQMALQGEVAYITQDYLAGKFPIDYGEENILINGSVLPSPQLIKLIQQMEYNEAFLRGEELIAAKLNGEQLEQLIHDEDFGELKGFDLQDTEYLKLDHVWDLFKINAEALRQDFEMITKGRTSAPISSTNQVLGKENVFLEEGASVECCTINATTGPVYIGKNALVMEGVMIRGPLAIGENSTIKMGAKVYGATTLGPYCKIGGEVKNSILQGYSSKSHEGYLGDAAIGEWCNLGADTNNSNLKNNYEEVKMWNYGANSFAKTGMQFCGLVMGDHSKTGINTMLNTGTMVGVSTNVFGSEFPRNFIPSFAWGGYKGFQTYRADKAFDTMERVMARRNVEFGVEDRIIMLRIFEDSSKYRRWEVK
jgi:UDP-N-acetylglucosamine diphosphorylase/glucosamine-1-phosphate N-acetyltransferase